MKPLIYMLSGLNRQIPGISTIMNITPMQPPPLPLGQTLTEQYGHLVGGADLAKLLGFRSTDTLRKAVANGTLTLSTFTVPGRQGRFALTSDVADWLLSLRNGGAPKNSERDN
ncbi:hypothetical protein [Rhodoferax sp. U11-2br]|uniref:hypothetical protein n=1 Tax=Rhodoferax sp. U11-2br TaxID=2838878 RepID=UPI001BE9C534|nr:hypothetical protein [Rhodoferax sp. U11-2br]MBT3066726.1 hypothetical protein [Rhodoferax sp. U11-2br]